MKYWNEQTFLQEASSLSACSSIVWLVAHLTIYRCIGRHDEKSLMISIFQVGFSRLRTLHSHDGAGYWPWNLYGAGWQKARNYKLYFISWTFPCICICMMLDGIESWPKKLAQILIDQILCYTIGSEIVLPWCHKTKVCIIIKSPAIKPGGSIFIRLEVKHLVAIINR